MSIFDSIKNAFGGKAESEADAAFSPSQMLEDSGIDPSGLDFNIQDRSITVSGEVADETDRQNILDILAGAPGITTVQDDMTTAEPAPEEPTQSQATPSSQGQRGAESYTVQSGDTLWRISEQVYGDGSNYMKIFEANTNILEQPDHIFPGQELVIPKLD